MKKLLSAVTSVAMSFSLMAGAFASPVSAAGSDTASQPKLNMGGVLDVSANKNAGESVEWNMGTAIAAPGMSVTLPVVVSKSTLEVTGAQFKINPKSPIKLTSVKAGEAYGANASYDGNLIVLERSSGKGVVADNDSVVLNLTFSVPSDCAEGDYAVEASDLFVSNAKSADITSSVKFGAGTIKVQKEINNGNVSWILDNVEGAPGETVTLKAYVSNTDGVLAVAGAQFGIKTESPIEFKSLKEGGAYASPISFDEKVQTYVFDSGSGKGVIAGDKATIMNISYTIPSTCPEGTYKVSWKDGFVSDSHTADITSKVKFVDGSIKVTGKTTTDKITWTLSNETAKPGDVVTMTAKVSDKSKAAIKVGGAQFKVDAATPITYNDKIAEGNAYGGAIKYTKGTDRFMFELDGAGKAAADDSTIFSIDFKVPEGCADGVYPVKWAETFVSDGKANDVTNDIVLVNGSITVGDVPVDVKGTATWVIPSEVQAEAGKTVELVAKVKGDSELSVAGAQFSIVGTEPPTLKEVAGNPYGFKLASDPEYKANCIFENATGATAKDGDTLFTITFDVPAGTPDGIYPVKWSKQFVTNDKSVDITDKVTFVDGSIKVGNPTTTTTTVGPTTTTTTVTGTTTTIPAGSLIWQIDTQQIDVPDKDRKVELKIYVNDKNKAKVGVAGAQFRINNAKGITLDSAVASEAYNAEFKTDTKTDGVDKSAVYFVSNDLKNVVAEDGKNVAVLTFNVPANTPEGTYAVKFADGSLSVTDEKCKDITKNIIGLDGAIIIKKPDSDTPTSTTTTTTGTTTKAPDDKSTTTTTVTVTGTKAPDDKSTTTTTVTATGTKAPDDKSTTTTTVTATGTKGPDDKTTTTTVTGTTTTIKVPEGAILWKLDTVHAVPGETVKVNMIVVDPNKVNLGVAAAQFSVTPSITGNTGAELAALGDVSAYGSKVVRGTDNSIRFVFEDKDSHSAADGAIVAEFSYKVGENAVPGTDIDLVISDLFVSNGKSVDISKYVIGVDGKIIIDEKPDTTPVSTTTTTKGPDDKNTTTTTVTVTGTKGPDDKTTTTTTVTGTGTKGPDDKTTTTTTVTGTGTKAPDDKSTTTTTVTVTGTKGPDDKTTTTTTVTGSSTSSSTTSTTTATGTVLNVSFTTTANPWGTLPIEEWNKTTTKTGYDKSYATIKTKAGFYFSHDNGVRALGDKGGFDAGQVEELVIYDVYKDGKIEVRSGLDMSRVNFGQATPEKVYKTRTHNNAKTTIDDFKYEVSVMYENMPLVNTSGEALTVPVYIGVKGDINLDNKVNAVDASTALSYYASYQTNGNTKESVICQNDTNGLAVTSPTDMLDHFAAFLGDVDTNEYDPNNWKTMKGDRTVNAVDASYILSFYAEKQTTDKSANDIWNDVLGTVRFGTK
ncbi:cohesin domain-containing protein [Ruminococcus flavefaciens]|uniref:Cohesin domain-containing protein n=1 Tax=Ruminococcus flavefaciens TaxID=1265 RepID=A0A1K1NX41_RUMFL|nr:cohesin domain-containing protein [Ruminococcus flavefaciens]SFW40090.1 Cohesin domain-containing protein [Ruminococcus flavefaciens]